jgi:putative transposase
MLQNESATTGKKYLQKTLKNEMFYNRSWIGVSIEEFIDILHEYLVWYNEKRIKLSLGAMSPLEYRRDLGLAA